MGLLTVLLLAGCALPQSGGAQSGADVPERSRPAGIKVIPPGPQRGAGAEDLVRGFLSAQASPDDDHAVARQFLLDPAGWDDDAFVVVYAAGSVTVRADPEQPDEVALNLRSTARIAADGAYRLVPADRLTAPERFRVARRPDGQLRLSEVPVGLRIERANLSRSYVPREVFFLGRSTGGTATSRLVADRVFLPVTVDPARALVEALLGGASDPLDRAVQSAAPAGTTLRGLTVTDNGQVTVDLSRQVTGLSLRDRQRLSAQLVWTLRESTGVRVLAEGTPLDVGATGVVQTVADWAEYDPDGVRDTARLLYVQDRRLRSLDALPGGGEDLAVAVPVDEGALDLAESQVGVLTQDPNGPDQVRIGPLQGPLGEPALARDRLASLSWGSGDRGLWVLEQAPTPRVWVLPAAGASEVATPIEVDCPVPRGAGPLSRLEVSRDGARIALVFGAGVRRRLYVGQVEPTATGLVVGEVVAVAPQLLDVTDVAWETRTSLVVLARDAGESGLLTLRVAVDGSTVAPLLRQGLEGTATAVAAAPGQPLVVTAGVSGGPSRLFRDDGQVLRQQALGRAPFYPG